MNWKQSVEVRGDKTGFLKGPPVELPIPPFPGLEVGSLTVKRVSVNQGGDDGECQIEYCKVSKGHAEILIQHSDWQWEGEE